MYENTQVLFECPYAMEIVCMVHFIFIYKGKENSSIYSLTKTLKMSLIFWLDCRDFRKNVLVDVMIKWKFIWSRLERW